MRPKAMMAGLLAASLSVSAVLTTSPARVQAESVRPDIIAIMVDDLGYLPGNPVLKRLPNIRRTFLDGGLELRRMYGQTPLCSPGRANFLTGQNSLHNGVTANTSGAINPRRSVAWALQRAGYHSSLVGKYFIDWGTNSEPEGWSDVSLFHDPQKLSAKSVESIQRAPTSQPLFAWVSSTAPHRCDPKAYPDYDCRLPYVPERLRGAPECQGIAPFKPPTYRTWTRQKNIPGTMPKWPLGWDLRSICESMLQVDEAVAAITAAQKERGRPAYYFLFSDNGMSWGQKGLPGKRVPTSTQLPMFVAGPGVAEGVYSGKLLSNIDIAPTMASLGRASMPWVDGRPFTKLLWSKSFDGRKRMLEHSLTPRAKWSAVRYKNWRYIRWADGRKQLYNLRQDRWESKNLAKQKPAMVKRLNAELNQLLQRSRT